MTIDEQIRDVEERISLLRAASRPTEQLTTKDGPTAQGHITSALSQLERERELLFRRKG